MTWSRAVRRPVAVLAAALAAAAGALAAPASAAPEDQVGALDVDITDIAPAVLRPGQTLTVSGTVVNGSQHDASAAELELSMQRYTPISRSELQRWMDPESYSITMSLEVADLGEIPAGTSQTFRIDVEPEALGLAESTISWGPHGIEAAVSDTGGTTLSGVDRSVVLWYPDVTVDPTPVNVVVPVVPNARERTQAGTDPGEGAVAEAAAPRLLELLDAVALPGVTVAVDGELLAPAEDDPLDDDVPPDGATEEPTDEPTTDEPTDDPTDETATEEPTGSPTDTSATATPQEPTDEQPTDDGPTGEEPTSAGDDDPAEPDAGELTATAAINRALTDIADGEEQEVAVLPWADADIAALAHLDADERHSALTDAAAAAAAAAGHNGAQVLAWPVTQTPDAQTVTSAARAGATTAVLPVSAVPPLDQLTYTPTGRADLAVGDGQTLPAVLLDDTASAVLDGRLPPIGRSDAEPVPLDPLDSRQMLLADTAVISRERPADPRAIAIGVSRAYDGDPAELADTLQALLTAPWVAPTTLSEVRGLSAPEIDRSTLPERAVGDSELSSAELSAMDSARSEAESFASVTAEPEPILDPIEANLSSLLSAAWRRDPQARGDLLAAVRARVAALDSQLVAMESSPVLLINSSASWPVHIRNELSSDVTVTVRLEPSDDRLQADRPVTVTIPASSQGTAEVPVRAVGSGDVTVSVQLLNAAGEPVGTPNAIRVRVRADWESVGTAVVAAGLGIVLVIGLVRTVRRGRRMEPASAEEVAE